MAVSARRLVTQASADAARSPAASRYFVGLDNGLTQTILGFTGYRFAQLALWARAMASSSQ